MMLWLPKPYVAATMTGFSRDFTRDVPPHDVRKWPYPADRLRAQKSFSRHARCKNIARWNLAKSNTSCVGPRWQPARFGVRLLLQGIPGAGVEDPANQMLGTDGKWVLVKEHWTVW